MKLSRHIFFNSALTLTLSFGCTSSKKPTQLEQRIEQQKIVENEKRLNENSDGDLLTDVDENLDDRNKLISEVPYFDFKLNRPAYLSLYLNKDGENKLIKIDSQIIFEKDLIFKKILTKTALNKFNNFKISNIEWFNHVWTLTFSDEDKSKVTDVIRSYTEKNTEDQLLSADLNLNLSLVGHDFENIKNIENVDFKIQLSKDEFNKDFLFIHKFQPEIPHILDVNENISNWGIGPMNLKVPDVKISSLLDSFIEGGDFSLTINNFIITTNKNERTTSYQDLIKNVKNSCYQLVILTEKGIETFYVSTKINPKEALNLIDPNIEISLDGNINLFRELESIFNDTSETDKSNPEEILKEKGKWIVLNSNDLTKKLQSGTMLSLVYLNSNLIKKYSNTKINIFNKKLMSEGNTYPLGPIKNNDKLFWEVKGKEKGGEFIWVDKEIRDWEICSVRWRREEFRDQPCKFRVCKARYLNYVAYEKNIVFDKNMANFRLIFEKEGTLLIPDYLKISSNIIQTDNENILKMETFIRYLDDDFQKINIRVMPDPSPVTEVIGYRGNNCRPDHDPFDTSSRSFTSSKIQTFSVNLIREKSSL